MVCVGYIEVVCDLVWMVGFELFGVICEVMNDDGSMVCWFELEVFVVEYGIKIGIIVDLIYYWLIYECIVECIVE